MAEPELEREEDTMPKPNLVQELAAADVKQELPPTHYVLRGQHHVSPLVANQLPEPIPVIDLSQLSSDAQEAAKLQAALQGWGLFLVYTHTYTVDRFHKIYCLHSRIFIARKFIFKLKCEK